MWNVVLLFLGLMKAVSYVAGSGTTADEKSVNRKYLEMPVAFREKTQFAISYVAAGGMRTDKEEKIKVFVDAGCSTSSKCKHGRQVGKAGM
ncbi:hypothetical protein G5I_11972 [Acromyrmex echinatior]|uniref:Uncharacterized protein n=1 Tax=Acromyrmex echinatior TaxID=103372 RepID=F4X115_ACREC|nr:hypothetical protein G5I_11972 [Acromyrmex echinatior]